MSPRETGGEAEGSLFNKFRGHPVEVRPARTGEVHGRVNLLRESDPVVSPSSGFTIRSEHRWRSRTKYRCLLESESG
jgi:hypothetical protein